MVTDKMCDAADDFIKAANEIFSRNECKPADHILIKGNEAFVSFTTAKLLKEKGFTDFCLYYYKGDSPIRTCSQDRSCYEWNNNHIGEEWYSAPTQQMAMSWLRAAKNIHIMPTIGCDVDRTPRIFYSAVIAAFNDRGDITYIDPLDENGYDNSEDAVEAALQFILKRL